MQRTILRIKDRLGAEDWGKTVLLAMTGFGRRVRENGMGGTDHGSVEVMLMPWLDVRDRVAHVMRGLYALERGVVEGAVFPGLEIGQNP